MQIELHIEEAEKVSYIPCAGEKRRNNAWHSLKERFDALTMV